MRGFEGTATFFAEGKKFAPKAGKVETDFIEGAKRPARILSTLRFEEGSLDAFDRSFPEFDNGYEHDFKLLSNESRPRQHPLCTDEDEYFWARRGGLVWETTIPDRAEPYLDDNWADPCEEMDLTIGIEHHATWRRVSVTRFGSDPRQRVVACVTGTRSLARRPIAGAPGNRKSASSRRQGATVSCS